MPGQYGCGLVATLSVITHPCPPDQAAVRLGAGAASASRMKVSAARLAAGGRPLNRGGGAAPLPRTVAAICSATAPYGLPIRRQLPLCGPRRSSRTGPHKNFLKTTRVNTAALAGTHGYLAKMARGPSGMEDVMIMKSSRATKHRMHTLLSLA
jgi:hypothetical protein